ncbi:UDP-glycosyltransferase [Morus notabilis]|uniref:Glycosyltransferase n=1 Tax=Morus notabilis TaxID=981085 RepID=W9QUV5_9ROSA|nr:UDP-glycosyltransferase 74B1 [Morus notabilis]EXB42069.1 UDP-glycosyltransferase [Morus notabilis]
MKSQKQGHVLVVTYPAQGHINPLLQFAKRLASKGLKTTLATTPYTLKSITTTTTTSLQIEPISDGYDESGFSQAPSLEAYLESFRAVGSKSLEDLIVKSNNTTSPVNSVVYDSLLPWALDVARAHGVLCAAFMTNSASCCSLYWRVDRGGLDLEREKGSVLVVPGVPPLGVNEMPSFLNGEIAQSPYLALIMEKFKRLEENDWVFCNSFEELEGELVKAMQGLWPLQMVGPMVPSAYLDQQIEGDTSYGASLWKLTSDQHMTWLSTKPPNSVIYVSFGSMADISHKQVEEIAWGLKASEKHFLWVIKEPKNKLPNGFLNSLGEAGMVVTWCDQLEVLSHQAVGCFVTHCGWNSTLEGLSLGVPMVAVPQWSDQPMNSKFVEEVWGVGVRAGRNEEGIVGREAIAMSVRAVMEGERSGEIRRNALKWRVAAKKAVSIGGSSDRIVDSFVELLKGKKNEG